MGVTGEDKIAGLDRLMTGVAALHERRVGRFAVVEVSVAPAAGRSVFFGVLDHELNAVLGTAGHEGLRPAKGYVVFLRRVETPRQPGDDGAIRKRDLSFAVCLD